MDDISLIIAFVLSGIVIGAIIFISVNMNGISKEINMLRRDIYRMSRGLGLDDMSIKNEMDIELKELIDRGKTAKAVKIYMEITGANFTEAIRYVDYLKGK